MKTKTNGVRDARIVGLIEANTLLVERSREIAHDAEIQRELALTCASALARVRNEIREVAKSLTVANTRNAASRNVLIGLAIRQLDAIANGEQ